jgi:hypothetical protein
MMPGGPAGLEKSGAGLMMGPEDDVVMRDEALDLCEAIAREAPGSSS